MRTMKVGSSCTLHVNAGGYQSVECSESAEIEVQFDSTDELGKKRAAISRDCRLACEKAVVAALESQRAAKEPALPPPNKNPSFAGV